MSGIRITNLWIFWYTIVVSTRVPRAAQWSFFKKSWPKYKVPIILFKNWYCHHLTLYIWIIIERNINQWNINIKKIVIHLNYNIYYFLIFTWFNKYKNVIYNIVLVLYQYCTNIRTYMQIYTLIYTFYFY